MPIVWAGSPQSEVIHANRLGGQSIVRGDTCQSFGRAVHAVRAGRAPWLEVVDGLVGRRVLVPRRNPR